MKTYRFFIFCIPLLILSCSNNDDEGSAFTADPPEIPADVKFDLNEDGVDDVLFRIGPDDVLTDGTVGYAGYVYPLNEASLMISSENEYSWIFDKQLNDTIEKAETKSATWYPSHLGFISIDDTPEGQWPNEWNISGQKKNNPFYLGMQIKENNQYLVGWLKLEINKNTAEVSLKDSKFTQDDFIVIDE